MISQIPTTRIQPFRPPRWLRNPHVQTILGGKYLRPDYPVTFRRRRLDTPDGDFLDVDFADVPGHTWQQLGESAPIVLLLPGLASSARVPEVRAAYHELARCGRKTAVLPVRIRYQLLSIAVFLGIFSFALRVPYFTISFFYPEFFSTPLAQGLFGTSKLFGLVRVSWLFFFLPDKVYEWALRPFLLIDKWLAFHRLRRLQTEIIALLSLTVRLHFDDKGWHSLRQVNVRNYDAVIAIMEGKKKLLQTDFTAFARSDRLRYAFLQKVLAPIQDQDDYDARVAAYRQASRAYGRFLRLCGYGWLAKPAPDAGLRAWTDEALAAAAQLVGTLNLDFNQFSVADFVQVLERVKGRKIFLFAIPMPDLFYGAWLSDADHPHEYIFYDSSLPPLHQVHVQLHELGHYLFGHKTKQITEADFLQLATAVQTQSVSTFLQPLLMYKPYHTLEKQQFEAEAEAIATITQAQALASSMAGRLTAVSHNNDIENLLYEMGIK